MTKELNKYIVKELKEIKQEINMIRIDIKENTRWRLQFKGYLAGIVTVLSILTGVFTYLFNKIFEVIKK